VVLDVGELKLGFLHGELVASADRQPQWIAGEANDVGGGNRHDLARTPARSSALRHVQQVRLTV
jgi:hypothetical protein